MLERISSKMPEVVSQRAFPPPDHNHGQCLAHALQRAEAAFEKNGLRLTELRRHVFTEIANSHHSIGAYEILERLSAKGTRLAPISVYRAIDALIEAGVVHRLECRNAYFACHNAHRAGVAHMVLACERCGSVAEVPESGAFAAIEAGARAAGFLPRSSVVEVIGRCAHCKTSPADEGARPGAAS